MDLKLQPTEEDNILTNYKSATKLQFYGTTICSFIKRNGSISALIHIKHVIANHTASHIPTVTKLHYKQRIKGNVTNRHGHKKPKSTQNLVFNHTIVKNTILEKCFLRGRLNAKS